MADEEETIAIAANFDPPSPIMASERPYRRHHPIDTTRIKEILALPTIEAQIEAFAFFRRNFSHEFNSVSYAHLQQYMASSVSLSETIDRIAEPIEDLWRTGDNCAADSLPCPPDSSWNSAVGSLMDLWYGIMHLAKCTSWTDEAGQNKLVDIIAGFRARPSPTRTPEQDAVIEKLCPEYWGDGEGELWSELPWYGLCAAEVKNDVPGCGSGCQYAEGVGWANLMGYQARLVLAGDPTRAWHQELGALDVLDNKVDAHHLDVMLPAAAVWVLLLREDLYEREELIGKKEPEWQWLNPDRLWRDSGKQVTAYSTKKWRFWKERFAEVAGDESVRVETSRIAGCVAEVMDAIERGKGRRVG